MNKVGLIGFSVSSKKSVSWAENISVEEEERYVFERGFHASKDQHPPFHRQ